jgi:hypothetical protein
MHLGNRNQSRFKICKEEKSYREIALQNPKHSHLQGKVLNNTSTLITVSSGKEARYRI